MNVSMTGIHRMSRMTGIPVVTRMTRVTAKWDNSIDWDD